MSEIEGVGVSGSCVAVGVSVGGRCVDVGVNGDGVKEAAIVAGAGSGVHELMVTRRTVKIIESRSITERFIVPS